MPTFPDTDQPDSPPRKEHFSRGISSRHIIIVATGYVLSLLLLGFAANYGLDNLNMLNQRLNNIVYENNEKAVQMNTMRNAIRERLLLLYNAMDLTDPFEIDEVWQKFSNQARVYIVAREKLYATSLTNLQIVQLGVQRETLRQAQPVLDTVFETLKAGKTEQARTMLLEAKDINNNVLVELKNMIDQQQRLSKQAVQDGVNLMHKTRHRVYGIIGLAIVVAAVILLIIVMVIMRQAKAGRVLLRQLEEANAGLEKNVAQRTAELEQQSSRNELIVNTAMDGFFIANFQGRMLDCNDVFCNMLGYPRGELIQLSLSDIQPQYSEEEIQSLINDSIEQGNQYYDTCLLSKQGQHIDVEISITVASIMQEQLIFSYVHDITERKREEKQLKQQQQQLSRIADEEKALASLLHQSLLDSQVEEFLSNALDVLFSEVSWLQLTPRGAIFLVRKDADEMVLDMCVERNLTEKVRESCKQVQLGYCLCGQAAQNREIIYAGHVDDQHSVQFEDMEDHGHYVLPLMHRDELLGVMTLYIQAAHERSEQEINFLSRIANVLSLGINKRAAEQALVTAKLEAEDANRAKSDFLNSMSHELRTPLNAILGFSQLLEIQNLDELCQSNVREIKNAGEHLLELINEILDLAKIEAGQTELSLTKVELLPIIEECYGITTPLAAQRNICIALPESAENFAVHADYMRLKQVVLNLLSNAIKYNRDQGVVQLTLSNRDNAMIRLAVTDSGYGIKEEHMNQLFEPFNRLQNEYSGIEGTGIGLVIARSLVELMGGSIGVESIFGKGSTFYIDLPAEKDNSTETNISARYTELNNDKADGKTATVLYIEDNDANLRLVSQIFEHKADIDLLTASEPVTGLKLAQEQHPDLILLDINLPKMNGNEVLKRLRADPLTRHIPVIAVSANAMHDDIEKSLSEGFDEYITKPINVEQFVSLTRQFL